MYQLKYEVPLVCAVSLAVALLTTYVAAGTALAPEKFVSGALVSEPEIVDCELSDGTQTQCYQIVTAGVPADAIVGPFCPGSITSSESDSGIWLDGSGVVFDADGEFIVNLPALYEDDHWQLYDKDTGKVNVTDTQEACEAAARPDVDEAYQNYCVECSLEYLDGGLSKTYLIPVEPVVADEKGALGIEVGVTLNGIPMAAPAPVDAILGNYTIAAFDDCGGHVNMHEGYHYHAATGCTESEAEPDGHAAQLGYALDGYGIYALLDSEGNEPESLDECRGATDEVRGYHYHAASAGENMFISCFNGKTVALNGPGGPQGRGGPGGPPPPGAPGKRPTR